MAFDISQMSQNIGTYGVVKNNSFDVNIAMPPIMTSLKGTQGNDFSYVDQFNTIMPFRAMSVNPPGVALLTNETHNLGIGPRIKQAYNAGFSTLRIQFISDAGGIITSFMTAWLNETYNYSFSKQSFATFYTQYRSQVVSPTVTINKYDKMGNIIETYLVNDCYPLIFVSSPLSWEDQNTVSKCTLDLHYTSYDLK